MSTKLNLTPQQRAVFRTMQKLSVPVRWAKLTPEARSEAMRQVARARKTKHELKP